MARKLRIAIAAVDKAGIGVSVLRAMADKEATPFYGVDEYRNARLIGAYHAHKGAGEEWLRSWFQTLGFRDGAYIRTYEAKGEWGRTDLVSAYDLGAKLGQGIAMGIMPGMSSYLADMQRQQAEAQLREEYDRANAEAAGMTKFGVNLDEALDAAVMLAAAGKFSIASDPGDLDDMLIILERIKLRATLERCHLPSVVACWVAGHLPAWLLPTVLYYRLQMLAASDGDVLLRWWRKLRG